MSNQEAEVIVETEKNQEKDFVVNFTAIKRTLSENKGKIIFGASLLAANLIGFGAGQMVSSGKLGCPLGSLRDGDEGDDWSNDWDDEADVQEGTEDDSTEEPAE